MAKSKLIVPEERKIIAPVSAAPAVASPRRLTSKDLPFKAVTWYLIVEPRLPKTYVGTIELAEETKKVEEIQTTIGTVLDVGPLFGRSATQAGLRLNEDPRIANLKEGDNVLYARYTGQKVHIRVDDKRRPVVLLTDSELMAVVDGDMDSIMFWI